MTTQEQESAKVLPPQAVIERAFTASQVRSQARRAHSATDRLITSPSVLVGGAVIALIVLAILIALSAVV